jgi:hypothetical protein
MSIAAPPDVPPDQALILNRSTEALVPALSTQRTEASESNRDGADDAFAFARGCAGRGRGRLLSAARGRRGRAHYYRGHLRRPSGRGVRSERPTLLRPRCAGLDGGTLPSRCTQAGGLIFPQLWHVGMLVSPQLKPPEEITPIGPAFDDAGRHRRADRSVSPKVHALRKSWASMAWRCTARTVI